MLDILLGEDETRATNRLALICVHCKLVNGLAPPGVKTPQEMGRWRCSSCKEWNGTQDEVQKIIEAASEPEPSGDASPSQLPMEEAEKVGALDGTTNEEEGEMQDDDTPARSTRSQTANPMS